MKHIVSILALACSMTAWGQKPTPRQQAFDDYNKYFKQAQSVHDKKKAQAIADFRQFYAENGYRTHSMDGTQKTAEYSFAHLNEDGRFTDLIEQEEMLKRAKAFTTSTKYNDQINKFMTEAWARLWRITDAYAEKKMTLGQVTNPRVLKGILYYTELELLRPQINGRFHGSCFMLPTAAANMYFDMLPMMEQVESGQIKDGLLKEVYDAFMVIGLQAWSQPYRDDDSQKNLVSIPRFRDHVWWVGGNAIAFRSLLPVAAMYRSIPMVDLLAEVLKKSLSMTSPAINHKTFWVEGITTDGCGYGHGKQCLIWGYPISSLSTGTSNLSFLKGSPWEQKLSAENKLTILSYLRGASFHYYKGHDVPCLDRTSMLYFPNPNRIKYEDIVDNVLNDWQSSFTRGEVKELKQLKANIARNAIVMKGQPDGRYNGTRFFWANDNFANKTPDYSLFVSMASKRVDGLESAPHMSDAWNFNTCDGLTLMQRTGTEYRDVFGAWDVLSAPGTTSRMGMDKLTPVVNWRGYCSKENFCGAVADGRKLGVAGYLFDKMNASDKLDINDRGDSHGKNAILYGVRAHKAYFMLPGYMVALGAGITDAQPEAFDTEVHTTIDQTAWRNKVYAIQTNGKKKALQAGQHTWGDAQWLVQDGQFAYTILPPYRKQAHFSLEKRAADYVKMNIRNKRTGYKLPTEVSVLQLWMNHGVAPTDAQYGYAVYTGKGKPPRDLPFEVLQNNKQVQAIAANGVVEAVFYDASATLQAKDHQLQVSHPCTLMLVEKEHGVTELYLNDPTQNNELDAITVTLDGSAHAVKLPHDGHCGDVAKLVVQ